jgi:hypothetical protein
MRVFRSGAEGENLVTIKVEAIDRGASISGTGVDRSDFGDPRDPAVFLASRDRHESGLLGVSARSRWTLGLRPHSNR